MKVSDQKCFTGIFTFLKPNLSKVTARMTVPLETTEKVLTNSGNREGQSNGLIQGESLFVIS